MIGLSIKLSRVTKHPCSALRHHQRYREGQDGNTANRVCSHEVHEVKGKLGCQHIFRYVYHGKQLHLLCLHADVWH